MQYKLRANKWPLFNKIIMHNKKDLLTNIQTGQAIVVKGNQYLARARFKTQNRPAPATPAGPRSSPVFTFLPLPQLGSSYYLCIGQTR